MGELTKDEKTIFKDIYMKDKKIKVLKVDELIKDNKETNTFAENLANKYKVIFEEVYTSSISEQQQKFSYDCARILRGEFKEKKPILVSAKAGFGKSTLIRTFLDENINILRGGKNDWGAIIVSDRIKDLKDLQKYFQKLYGSYRMNTYYDDNGDIQIEEIPWVYVLESWNEDVCLDKQITKYDERNCNKINCEYYEDCKISRQFYEQEKSPIVAMSNARLNSYLAERHLENFSEWKFKGGAEVNRKIMIIDEKPKLENNDEIDVEILRKMISNVNLIKEINKDIIEAKKILQSELLKIQQRLVNWELENIQYRNNIILNNDKHVFSNKFKEYWNKYYRFEYRYKIKTIETLFEKGGLWCRTDNRRYFKLIDYVEWNADINTVIFDATSESDPSYKEVFNYLDINDYKDYSHLNFNIVNENLSRRSLNEHPKRLSLVAEWIEKDIVNKGKVYIVTYMNYAKKITDSLMNFDSVILDEKDGEKIIPYFGNTKGKNNWRECDYMVLLGWNRYPSDEYLASYLSVNFHFDEARKRYFEDSKKQTDMKNGFLEYFKNVNGIFVQPNIEFHKLCKIMVEFEQEIFRTKVRDFGCNDTVNIYIFKPEEKLIEMIEQRFLKCNISNVNIPELNIEKIVSRKNNEGNKELLLYEWLKNWDGTPKIIKELKEELCISNDYWKDLKRKPLIKKIWEDRKIESKRQGRIQLISISK